MAVESGALLEDIPLLFDHIMVNRFMVRFDSDSSISSRLVLLLVLLIHRT